MSLRGGADELYFRHNPLSPEIVLLYLTRVAVELDPSQPSLPIGYVCDWVRPLRSGRSVPQ
jgi:hypothetical protein